MADDIKLARQRARGAEAKRLWENSMIQEFFTKLENEIKEALFASKGDESDIRERCYLMMRLHQNYKSQFRTFMYTGDIAAKELLEIEEERKRG